MKQIETISLAVDEASKEDIKKQKESNVFLLKYDAPVQEDIDEQHTTDISDDRKGPGLDQYGTRREILNECLDNPCFYEKNKSGIPGSSSFADVVEEVIKEHLRNDVHPFGRSSVYRKVIGVGERTSVHQDDSPLFMWALATIIILSVAVGVIVMSQMHHAEYHDHITLDLTKDSNVTAILKR